MTGSDTASGTITAMTNLDPDFYRLLGPFLASRAVAAAVGGPIWDQEDKTWFVARTDAGAVTGFAGSRTGRGVTQIESCYTIGGDEQLAARLITAAVEAASPSPCTATAIRSMAGAYLKAGFVVLGETANFVKLARKG